MPITTLNRVIAIFIVGAVPLAWLFLRNDGAFPGIATPDTIVAGLLLVPVTAFVGLVFDGVAEIPRTAIRKVTSGRNLQYFPWNRDEYGKLRVWEKQLTHLDVIGLDEACGEDQFQATNFAAGYFLSNASKDEIEWLNSHFSSYSLATCFAMEALILGVIDMLCFFRCWEYTALEGGAIVAAIYALLNIAVDSYIYSYHLAVRFTVIHLMQHGDG